MKPIYMLLYVLFQFCLLLRSPQIIYIKYHLHNFASSTHLWCLDTRLGGSCTYTRFVNWLKNFAWMEARMRQPVNFRCKPSRQKFSFHKSNLQIICIYMLFWYRASIAVVTWYISVEFSYDITIVCYCIYILVK